MANVVAAGGAPRGGVTGWLQKTLFATSPQRSPLCRLIVTVLVVFVGCTLWTVWYSFTKSKMLPSNEFVGFDQYIRLSRPPAGTSRFRTF